MVTTAGALGWARKHLVAARLAIFGLAVAVELGIGALGGVLFGNGPADGLGHAVGPIIGLTLYFGYQAYRTRTAPRREQRRQHEQEKFRLARRTYEATYRGGGGQGSA